MHMTPSPKSYQTLVFHLSRSMKRNIPLCWTWRLQKNDQTRALLPVHASCFLRSWAYLLFSRVRWLSTAGLRRAGVQPPGRRCLVERRLPWSSRRCRSSLLPRLEGVAWRRSRGPSSRHSSLPPIDPLLGPASRHPLLNAPRHARWVRDGWRRWRASRLRCSSRPGSPLSRPTTPRSTAPLGSRGPAVEKSTRSSGAASPSTSFSDLRLSTIN
jgi:hypothetical protein